MIYAKGPRLRSKLTSFYRRCRCYTCLTHPDHAAVLRRPTRAASSSGILFNPAVTVAFYSSVICYGAMWDSQRKRDRRKSLDNAILEAEHELSATHKKHASRLAALGMEAGDMPGFAPSESSSQELHRIRGAEASEDKSRFRRYHTTSKLQNSAAAPPIFSIEQSPELASSLRLLGKGVLELLNANQIEVPEHTLLKEPNSIYADESARATTSFTPKKLLLTEYSVAKMASHLVRSVTPPRDPKREELSQRALDLTGQLDILAGEDSMWTQSVSRLSHPQFNPDIEDAEEMLEQLNRAITSLAATRARDGIRRRRFAKLLALRFLTSPVAPTKAIYTNLIKHLSRLGEYGMVDIVLACVDKSCVRYDELLIDTILVHYIRSNRGDRFAHFHQRMCGMHGGLMLAKTPHITELSSPPPWKTSMAQSEKFAAYIPPDARIWESLISGYLSFGSRDMAQLLYEKMAASGLVPGLRVLAQLMRQAMNDSDHTLALQYWQTAKERCFKSAQGRLVHGSAEHHCIRVALQFCKQSGRSDMFQQIYRAALERGLWVHALLPRVIPKHLARTSSYSASLTRRVHVLQQRAAAFEEDFVRFSLFGLASQMLLQGKTLSVIEHIFAEMSKTSELTQDRKDLPQAQTQAQIWQLISAQWHNLKPAVREEQQQQRQQRLLPQRPVTTNQPVANARPSSASRSPAVEPRVEQHAPMKRQQGLADAHARDLAVRSRRIWAVQEVGYDAHDGGFYAVPA